MMLIKAMHFIKETIKTDYSYHVNNPGTAWALKIQLYKGLKFLVIKMLYNAIQPTSPAKAERRGQKRQLIQKSLFSYSQH